LLPSQPEASFPIHACNLPARTVSGDFYDYLEIGDGCIAFCLGDVSGKGINAALLMAKASSLYRLLARTSDCTASLLRVLNDELHARTVRGMFVTMLAGVYEPSTGRVRIANAGHEPALLRDPEGRIREIGADAPPLGILPSAEGLASLTEQVFELGGGSLYVFSDGLTEALDEHGEQLGAAGLKRLIERFAERPLHGRVEALMSAVNGLDARDDLTLLCLDPNEHGVVRAESELTIRFRAQAAELAGARSRVRELLDGADVEESVGADIVLAIDEACQNVIRHCYGEAGGDIVLRVRLLGDTVEVELTDFGPCVDPSALEGRDLDDVRPGGLGIHLIRGCMDDVGYRDPPAGGGNVLRMVKRLHMVEALR
jgi:sigma-B regulation protein RsbU (phosphoserine phosphatase)